MRGIELCGEAQPQSEEAPSDMPNYVLNVLNMGLSPGIFGGVHHIG